MAQPRLTEFLLNLATNAPALRAFQEADTAERRAICKEAGLTAKQCTAILSGKAKHVSAEVQLELERAGVAHKRPHAMRTMWTITQKLRLLLVTPPKK